MTTIGSTSYGALFFKRMKLLWQVYDIEGIIYALNAQFLQITGAIIGAYAGGSLVNETGDPTMWDWQDGSTYFGMVIGGAAGAMGGYIAGDALAGTGIATFTASASVSAGGASAGGASAGVSASATVGAGVATSTNLSVWGAAGITAGGVTATTFAGYSIYNSGLGTYDGGGYESDFSFGGSCTYDSGSGDPMPMYGLNMNTPAGMNTYNSSVTYGHIWTKNSVTGWTDQGFLNARGSEFAFYYHNDTRIPPSFGIKGTDQGWTAGIGMSYSSREGLIDIYHEHFTSIGSEGRHRMGGRWYWEQQTHNMAYNRATTAVRFRNRTHSMWGAPWGQNIVHDLLGSPRFHYRGYQ